MYLFIAKKKRIIGASHQPMSIIIVGVGQADFTQMEALDADEKMLEAKGVKAQVFFFFFKCSFFFISSVFFFLGSQLERANGFFLLLLFLLLLWNSNKFWDNVSGCCSLYSLLPPAHTSLCPSKALLFFFCCCRNKQSKFWNSWYGFVLLLPFSFECKKKNSSPFRL